MREFFQQLAQLRHLKRSVALATLVNTVGTSPRKEGAKMWAGEGGDILGSVTIGGCVDAYVIEQAEAVLADQVPRLIELPLGDEDAWELGLSCAGTIEVFIEPLSAAHSQPFDLYTVLKSHLDSGAVGALLTSVDGAAIGAKLLLLDDGTTLGSLGDPTLDQEACKAAQSYMAQGLSRTLSFALPHTTARVFVEVHTPPATLIIVAPCHHELGLYG